MDWNGIPRNEWREKQKALATVAAQISSVVFRGFGGIPRRLAAGDQ
jgi:hypothetical protein